MGIESIIYILIVLAVILISMTLHEAMHAYASFWLGDYTAKIQGRLTLNPIKHIDPVLTILLPITLALLGGPIFGGAKPVPINPFALRGREWGMALVAIAGPMTNFVIAFVSYGIWAIMGYPVQSLEGQIVLSFVSVNLGFFVFNMLPIPPLDGSRILYALAPEFVQRGMDVVERYGVLLVFGIILVAGDLFGVLMGGLINFFFELFGDIFIS